MLRIKGLLFFKDVSEATALQCVGTHIELERLLPEQMPAVAADGPRRSRLVLIGRTAGLGGALAQSFENL